MKEIRVKFTKDEYDWLSFDAGQFGTSVEELTHDRAIGVFGEDWKLDAVKVLMEEMAKVREALNQRIRWETEAEEHLQDRHLKLSITRSVTIPCWHSA